MKIAKEHLDHALVLMVWWSAWTAADRYLIPFTPVSEIVVLASALALALARAHWVGASAECSRVISEVTHTPTPSAQAKAYGRQVDTV